MEENFQHSMEEIVGAEGRGLGQDK